MAHEESILQRQCVKWFRIQYPKLTKMLFAIPNGGKRKKIEAAIMKGEGVVAGVADMFLMVHPGVFIEFKTKDGKQSPDQKDFQVFCQSVGYRYYIIRDFDTFMKLIKEIFHEGDTNKAT